MVAYDVRNETGILWDKILIAPVYVWYKMEKMILKKCKNWIWNENKKGWPQKINSKYRFLVSVQNLRFIT